MRNLLKFLTMIPVIVLVFLGLTFGGSWVTKSDAASGINKQINFQGKLVDGNGLVVADNTYTVVFSLYNVSAGGSAAWTETDSVTTKNGVFQVALGANTSLPGNVDFNSDTWYLGIKVNTDAEMSPRIRFSAVPYAFNAAALDGIVATNSATQFTISGSTNSLIDLTVNGSLTLGSIIQPTNAGALTIQSNNTNALTLDTGAAAALNIGTGNANSILIGNSGQNPNFTFQGTGLVLVTNRSTISSGLSNGMIYYDTTAKHFSVVEDNGSGASVVKVLCNKTDLGCGTGGSVTLQAAYNSGQTIDLSQAGTGLTIGTNAGNQNIIFAPNAGGQAGLVINDQGLGDVFTASVSGNTKLVLSHSGNLGIGSSSPQEELTLGSAANLVGEMAVPTGATASITSNGSLSNGSYYYKISASDGIGETVGSAETSVCQSASNTHTCAVSWNSVVGAVSYKIYRTSTSGSYTGTNFLTSVTVPSYSDTGAVILTTGTPPTTTTAYVTRFTYSGNSWLIGDNFGLGTTSPLATLHIKGGKSGGNAAAIFDQIGASTNDILTASASGVTRFTVHNDGSIQTIGGNATADLTTITGGNGLTIMPKANASGAGGGLTLKAGNGTGAVGGSINIDAGTGSANGTITIGGTNATGITFGGSQNPTYSFSGTGTFQTSTGINTLGGAVVINGTTLTIGNGSDATIQTKSATNTALNILSQGSGNIVLGQNSGNGTVVVQPNAGGQASLIIKNQGTGDLLTASAGATAKFAVHNDGSVQVLGATTADFTTITAGNGLTILPKANASGAGGGLTLKGGNGSTTAGGVTIDSGTGTSGSVAIGTANATGLTFGGTQNPTYAFNGTGTVTFQGTSFSLGNGSTTTLQTSSNGGLTLLSSGTGDITLGQNSGTGNVIIAPNAGGDAALIINKQFSSGDVLAASVSGTTKFVVHNDGSMQVLGATTADLTTITGGNGLTILPKANTSGVGGGLTLKAGNGTGAAGGSVTLDTGTGSSNGTIALGTTNASAITIASSSITTTVQGSLVIGISGNTLTLNPAAGPTYAGNARPTKTMTISPEYVGAVLTAFYGAGTDTSITGNMTSDVETGTGSNANLRTYYQWLSSQTSLNYYTIAVRLTLPKDFDSWASGNTITIDYDTQSTGTTNNVLSAYIYRENNSTTAVTSSTGNASGTAATYTSIAFTNTNLTGGSVVWNTSDQTAILYLRMGSANSNYVHISDIKLNYLAKF